MKAFERFSSSNIFYIFVMREKDTNTFVILPSSEVQKQIHEHKIRTLKEYDKYRVEIIIRDGSVFIGNQRNEVTYFFNNWDILK
jgi:hypothetical protein